MTSFKIKTTPLLFAYNYKMVDIHHNKIVLDPVFEMRMMNPITRGVQVDERDDRRIGNIVNNKGFEFHYEYYQDEQPSGAGATNQQVYPTIIRHNFFWYTGDSTDTAGVDQLGELIFEYHGANNPDIHSPLNKNALRSKFLIPLYDKTFILNPITLGNKVNNVGIAPEVEYFYISYAANMSSGNTSYIEEGFLDFTEFYQEGFETVYGSANEHDVQTGQLVECWRYKNNTDDVNVDGWARLYYQDDTF